MPSSIARWRLMLVQPARTMGAAGLAALAAVLLTLKLGLVALAVPLALLALIVPLLNPRIALALLVGSAILFEGSTPNVLHFTTEQFHDPLPGHWSLLELLMMLAICSVVIDATLSRRIPLRPVPFGPVLGILTVALLIGCLVGHFGGEGFNPVTEGLRPMLPLIVVPWLTVNAIRDRSDLRRAIIFIGSLAAAKAALGLVGVVTHQGASGNFSDTLVPGAAGASAGGGTTITYYEPAENWLTMTFLMSALAALAARLRVSRMVALAVPLVALCLVLSFRRSFWIGSAAAIPFVVAIAITPVRRRILPIVAVVLAAAVWVTLSTGFVTDSNTPLGGSPLVQRVTSLSPTKLTTNPEDSYRISERKNVLAAIRSSPLVGIGFAVSWPIRYPLTITPNGVGQYVHFGVLYFWLRLGILGAIAYLLYYLALIVAGIRVFRRHNDVLVRVTAAGIAAGALGLAVAETTATWLGTDLRMTTLIGCAMGILSVALAQTRFTPTPAGPEHREPGRPLTSPDRARSSRRMAGSRSSATAGPTIR